MTSLFEKRDRWGNGVSLWIFAGLLFAVPMVALALTRIRMTNDVESWLPKHDRDARILGWFKQHFPAEDRVFVTWAGSSLHDPRVDQLVRKFTGTVEEDGVRRNGSPLMASVVTAAGIYGKLIDYGVEPDEAVDRLTGTLIGSGLINVRLSAAGRAQRAHVVKQLASLARTELGITLEVIAPSDQRPADIHAADQYVVAVNGGDGTALESEPTESIALPEFAVPAHDFRVKWTGMEPWSTKTARFCRLAAEMRGAATQAEPLGVPLIDACFQSPGSPVGMLVTLSEAGRADEAGVVREIRTAAAAVGIPDEELFLGGRAVTASELNEAVKRSFWNSSCGSWWPHRRSVMMLSGAIGIGLAFVFLRSVRLGLLVLTVSYFSTLVSTALVPAAGDSLNMVLMVMPTLLNVLTLSGAIHVANYWKHAAIEDPRTAIVRAVEMARQPCALASITTAIGLISLLTSDLGPVRQFGTYSAIGCLVALVMVLYVLPALLQLWPAPAPQPREIDSLFWKAFGGFLSRHGAGVTSACLVLFCVCTYGLVHFKAETKVIRYFPPNARVVRDSEAIEQSLAGISSIETVVRFDQQIQQKTSFLERLEIVRHVGRAIREHPQISGVISLADFQPVIEAPPQDAATFAKIKYNRRSSEAERRVKSDEEEGTRAFLAVAKDAADLSAPGDLGLNQAGDELWRVTGQAGMISDTNFRHLTEELDSRVQAVLASHPGTHHVVTGTVPLFLRTQMAVLESLISSFGLAFVIIALVMIVQLRSVTAGLLSMLPNLMPVGTVFGLLAWSGERVDVGSMVTASVALGIAVDGTLHLLTWFQDGIRRGMTRRQAVVESLSHCGP
ncbi:MAG: RND family transporter, partial [Planctomycetaceae bacterium]